MSGMLRSIGAKPTPAALVGVRVQTSIVGLPIPVVYGMARVAGNLIDYMDWSSSASKSGKGKMASKLAGINTTQATYKAAILIGLCEGPIIDILNVWTDKDLPADFETILVPNYGWNLQLGTSSQAAYSYVSTKHLDRAVPYQFLAYVFNPNIALPGDATPHYTWEIRGFNQFGAGKSKASGTTAAGGSATSFPTNLTQADHYFAGGYIAFGNLGGPGPPTQLALVTDYLNASGTVKVLPPGIVGLPGAGNNFIIYPCPDAVPSDVVNDLLTDVNHGLQMPGSMIGSLTSFHDYCVAAGLLISPVLDNAQAASAYLQEYLDVANTAAWWSDGVLKFLPYGDTAITGYGVTWTPVSTPIYNLTDDDFLHADHVDPIEVTRKPAAEAYNRVVVNYQDRLFQYNNTVAEAKDDAAIAHAGLVLAMPDLSYPSIKVASTARQVAQLKLQRSLWVRNTYKWTSPLNRCLLEPMDLVTLTDVGMGLVNLPVRITSVEWTEDNQLNFEAEDWPFGTATAALYGQSSSGGYLPSADIAPGATDAPFIVEAPVKIATSPLDLLIDVSGGPFWGGCEVWVSTDNATFTKVGQIVNQSNYGVTTGTFGSGVSPYPTVDNTNTCHVDLTASLGTLASRPNNDFLALLPLCYIADTFPEWIAYETAALTSANHFDLTHLYRGLYGTLVTSHGAGATFATIDLSSTGGTFRLAWPTGQVGDVLYFKFPAFNVYGLAKESLAGVASYAHTIGQAGVTPYDVIPQGTVSVASNGTVTAHADGPNSALSYRWASSTSSYPADATVAASGTIINGRSVDIGAGVLTLGQAIFITVIPFTGTSGTGTQLPSIHLIGTYQTFSRSKTARYTAASFSPINTNYVSATTNWSVASGALQVQNANAGWSWAFVLYLPQADQATLTDFYGQVYADATSAVVSTKLTRFNTAGGGTLLASMTSGTGGSQTLHATVSEVTTGNRYQVAVVIASVGAPGNNNASFYGFDVTWNISTSDKTL